MSTQEGSQDIEVNLLRRTDNYEAYQVPHFRVLIQVRHKKHYPKRKTVDFPTFNALDAMTDAEFDGSACLELGIGTWRKP